MTVLCFDTQQGLYQFQTTDLNTTLHSHPATEVIVAKSGSFDVICPDGHYSDVKFALIGANVVHAVVSKTANLTITMCEHRDVAIRRLAKLEGLTSDGISISTDPLQSEVLHQKILRCLNTLAPALAYDNRVRDSIRWIELHRGHHGKTLAQLASLTHLSQSRLSHLFKFHVGISFKKYLVWSRLKNCMSLHVRQPALLMDASFASGFYDQAHFTRAFKKMLGVPPTKAYSSRSVQVPNKLPPYL
ncbi:MAG: AraC family transcriptional regulator [Cyclobacteriaceae bacterium]|jgi:AraC-like DNA-binding protein|nr:AraC family transcriptional regulator [Cyclobacteriaceae bacterium]